MTVLDKQLAEQRRVSTDPNWPPANMVPATYVDGRHARSTTTKRDLLKACRALMAGGDFRPPMAAVCELARRSPRSGFEHFKTIEALHLAAIGGRDTRRAILEQALSADWEIAICWAEAGDENAADRLVRVIITGRATP